MNGVIFMQVMAVIVYIELTSTDFLLTVRGDWSFEAGPCNTVLNYFKDTQNDNCWSSYMSMPLAIMGNNKIFTVYKILA